MSEVLVEQAQELSSKSSALIEKIEEFKMQLPDEGRENELFSLGLDEYLVKLNSSELEAVATECSSVRSALERLENAMSDYTSSINSTAQSLY
jgi:uncharacterized coiled-coil DUF342 family protein